MIAAACAKYLVKSAMIVVLALLLFHGCAYVHCATVPQNSSADMLALIDFRQAINDPRGFFNSWNDSVDYCKWNGVTCSKTHPGRVRELKITGQSLEGRISPSLGNLTLLKILDLSSNNLSGQLPILNRLRKLEHLDLNNNNLQGSIPPEIGLLSNLVFLNLETNSFTGAIPSSTLNLTQVLQLLLSDNQLEGSIPAELGQLPKLIQLVLGGNRLSGIIPTTILNNSVIIVLDLSSNFLRMELPSNIGNTLPNLFGLDLHNNMLEGHIPASLGNVSFLMDINFSSNNFTGQVPSSLGKLKLLATLNLEQNMLEASDSKSWEFLHALGNCTGLQWLILRGNKLRGTIPD